MDQKRIEEIYSTLDTCNISLPKDAYLLGPKKMNEILVDIRKKADLCESLLREVSRVQLIYKKQLTNKKAIKRIEFDSLLALNDDIRKEKNQSMREAQAEAKLKDLNLKILELEELVLEFSALYDAIKSKFDNLNATRVDFNRMLSLIEMQIKLLPGDNLISNKDDYDLDLVLGENDIELVRDQLQRQQSVQKEIEQEDDFFDDLDETEEESTPTKEYSEAELDAFVEQEFLDETEEEFTFKDSSSDEISFEDI